MFKRNFIAGVLVLAPIGAVLWMVVWLWNLLMGLAGFIPEALHPRDLFWGFDALITILLLALMVVAVWFVGLTSSNYFGKRILVHLSRMLSRIPIISTVYSTLEQLLKTFATGQSKTFRRVVQVEYPRKGLYTLAFVTGERGEFLNIYVPTTPNPTSGFYLTVAANEVKDVNVSVEDALKEIISMGLVHKENIEEHK